MTASEEPLRAFLSHSAKARTAVAPILDRAEALLHARGWRTRVPRRAAQGSVDVEERRRLREQSYAEIKRSDLVFHLPAPAALSGARLNRELQRAVRLGQPIWLLICDDLRTEHGIGAPDPERLDLLLKETRGTALRTLSDLSLLLGDWPTRSVQR